MEVVGNYYVLVSIANGKSIHNVRINDITDAEAMELAKKCKQAKFVKQVIELINTCTNMTYEQAIKSILKGDNDVKD